MDPEKKGGRAFMEEIRRKYQAICSAFQKNPDGSWTSTAPVKIDVPGVEMNIEAGQTFKRGEKFQDVDIAEWLNDICADMTFGPI